ncbi:MAG TPA: hypothetical protein VHW25_07190 [Steroidobacteraceae bacterium]|jgi:hypothetical protein|nr:hypothetical protein [Steroidobacteraceae bacterium]
MRALRALLSAAALGALSLNAAAAAPDLSGVWFISHQVGALKTVDGKTPPLTAAAHALYDAHKTAIAKGDYSFDGVTHCLPPGLPRLMLMREPFEILQRPKTLYFVHQINRLPRRVYLDEALPTDVDPHYLGYSVGKWDDDALVVDSNGFEDGTLLDNEGLPHSDALHLTERYQLSKDGMHLHLLMTIDDPKTFTQAWTAEADYTKRPGYEIPEDVCADTPVAKRPRN